MSELRTWHDWSIVQKIGQGSFGNVYRIQRNVFGTIEQAALKIISIPQSDAEIEELRIDGYDDESIRQRYRNCLEGIVREYTIMASLKGNSNIVDCDDLDYNQHTDGIGWDIFIKMELLTPLARVIRDGVQEEDVVKLGIDICRALELCQANNIVHRDIKPQNILVSRYGVYKLGDFGIAKIAAGTAIGTKAGTYPYMAPEVYNNRPYGIAADVYSLGLVLYWILNERRTPFLPLPPVVPTAQQGNDALKQRFRGDALPEPCSGSPELRRIVMKACAFSTEDRYATPGEMLRDLRELQERRNRIKPKPPVKPRRLPVWFPAACAALLAAIAFLTLIPALSRAVNSRKSIESPLLTEEQTLSQADPDDVTGTQSAEIVTDETGTDAEQYVRLDAETAVSLSHYVKRPFDAAAATSELVNTETGEIECPAEYAIDGRLWYTWQEGVDGNGVGESLTLSFSEAAEIALLRIHPGQASTEQWFRENGRPSKLGILFSDGTAFTAELGDYSFDDATNGFCLVLDEPVTAQSVQITILEAVAGNTYTDTVISEIEAYEYQEDGVVAWTDEALEQSVREILDIKDREVMLSDLLSVTELDLSNRGIVSVEDMRYFANLSKLNLNNNQIRDITPLAALKNLTQLKLDSNYITDLSPVSSLSLLNLLFADYNAIENVEALRGLRFLRELALNGNAVRDIGALADSSRLAALYLAGNRLEDIGALAQLHKLQLLQLDDNEIGDISPLGGLTSLTWLYFDRNQVWDISVLFELEKLKTISLGGNPIDESVIEALREALPAADIGADLY